MQSLSLAAGRQVPVGRIDAKYIPAGRTPARNRPPAHSDDVSTPGRVNSAAMSILKALAAGLAVGIALIEGLCQALAAFTPLPLMCPPGPHAASGMPYALPLALIWLAGGAAAGAMASGMARRRTTGWITGAALCIPLALIAVLSDTGGNLAFVALPLFAAGAGAEFAGRMMARDRSAHSPDGSTAL